MVSQLCTHLHTDPMWPIWGFPLIAQENGCFVFYLWNKFDLLYSYLIISWRSFCIVLLINCNALILIRFKDILSRAENGSTTHSILWSMSTMLALLTRSDLSTTKRPNYWMHYCRHSNVQIDIEIKENMNHWHYIQLKHHARPNDEVIK